MKFRGCKYLSTNLISFMAILREFLTKIPKSALLETKKGNHVKIKAILISVINYILYSMNYSMLKKPE